MSTRSDIILLVCGVPSERLLHRIRSTRLGQFGRAWRFIDFAALGDAEFVEEAHWRLLGRAPRPEETSRRRRDIARGMTRAEVVLRLVGSIEGRRYRATAGGVILPVMVYAAGMLERLRSPKRGETSGPRQHHRRNDPPAQTVETLGWFARLVRPAPSIGSLVRRSAGVVHKALAQFAAPDLPESPEGPHAGSGTPACQRGKVPLPLANAPRDPGPATS